MLGADKYRVVTDERPFTGTKCARTQFPPAHLRSCSYTSRSGSLLTLPEPSKPRRRWHSQRPAAGQATGFR